jgi:hypothetical protein
MLLIASYSWNKMCIVEKRAAGPTAAHLQLLSRTDACCAGSQYITHQQKLQHCIFNSATQSQPCFLQAHSSCCAHLQTHASAKCPELVSKLHR